MNRRRSASASGAASSAALARVRGPSTSRKRASQLRRREPPRHANARRGRRILRRGRRDDVVQPRADLRERKPAAFTAAIAPLVAERETDVEQLEQLAILARLRDHRIEQREELVAAAISVQLGEQSVAQPLASPGSRSRRVIEHGTECVAGDEAAVFGDPGSLGRALEAVELPAQPRAETGGVGMA